MEDMTVDKILFRKVVKKKGTLVESAWARNLLD